MISSFKYISPVQEAYSKVVESETSEDRQQTDELLDSKKGSTSLMDDSERMLFYKDEIKRLRRIQKYYEQQRRYSNGQGYANYALKNTIEKYQRELDRMNKANQANQANIPAGNQPAQGNTATDTVPAAKQ